MRWRIPLVAILALFVAVSCDATTAPTETAEVTPLFDAGKSPNKGMELIWTYDYPEPEGYLDYIPCFNDGQGEEVLAFGHLEFWARTVETPSGNFKQHGEFRGYEHYRGQETGDLWLGSGLVVPTIFYHTHHATGNTTLNEPVWNYVENQRTGAWYRLKWNFHQVYDAEGNFLRADVKVTNCMPWNGRVH